MAAKAQPRKTARPASSKAADVQILQVRPDRSIAWPDGTLRGRGPHREIVRYDANKRPVKRDVPAYAVRADDPFIARYLHNLEPAPEGVVPVDRASWPRRWQAVYEERMGRARPDTRSKRERSADALLATGDDADVIPPALDDLDLSAIEPAPEE
jgi:hypothetical protein